MISNDINVLFLWCFHQALMLTNKSNHHFQPLFSIYAVSTDAQSVLKCYFSFSSRPLFWLALFLISSFGIKWRKFSTKICPFLQDFVVKDCQAHAAGLSPGEWPSHLTWVLFKELNQSPVKIQPCLWDTVDALRDLQREQDHRVWLNLSTSRGTFHHQTHEK